MEEQDRAKRMIEGAFGEDIQENHPLAFVREPRFNEIVKALSQVYTDRQCDIKEVLCSIVEILIRLTPYDTNDPRMRVQAARAVPIIRQLLAEQKGGSDILMVIASMLTNISIYASTADL